MRKAVDVADRAIAAGANTPLLLNLCAHGLQLAGRYVEAIERIGQALRTAPNDPFLLNTLGGACSKSGRPRDALEAFDAAIAARPDFAPAHHGRGLALSALGERVAARTAQHVATRLDPRFAEPLGALAAMAVEDEDPADARSYALRALALDPHQPAASLSLASLDLRDGAFERVTARARSLLAHGNLTLLHEGAAQRLLADALDGLARPAEAMTAYLAANAAFRRVHMTGVEAAGLELGVELCERLLQWFTAAAAEWAAPPASREAAGGGARRHVFLVGFPRSGTTLLQQVLASHPEVVSLEERPTLDPVLTTYFSDDAALRRLETLDGDAAARERTDYWQRVARFGVDPAGKVFVDKMPLDTIYLPLIAKLFPDATVILALRDPRDVVLSCFRRRFRPNTLVVEFTDLARTARFYDGVMRLAALYTERLPLPVHLHRHESLIEDFDGETRRLCGFLDLPWQEALRNFAETARRRPILTPSASQVRRGLNRDGMGHWRAYRNELDAIRPIIQPWVVAYGYPED